MVSCASGWRAHRQWPSGPKILGVDRRLRGLVSRLVSEAHWGRCALQVGVIVAPRMWPKRIEMTTCTIKGAPFFSGSPLLKNPRLSVLVGEQSWDGWHLGSFLGNMWARTKHDGKTCSDLWGQSTIIKAIPNNYPRSGRGPRCYITIIGPNNFFSQMARISVGNKLAIKLRLISANWNGQPRKTYELI